MPGLERKAREYRIKLPQQTLLLNEYLKIHRLSRAKCVKNWAWFIGMELKRAGWRPAEPCMEHCNIEIIRCCETGKVDWDGLYGGVKPLLDALTRPHPKINKYGLGVIFDDNVTRIKKLEVIPLFEFSGKPWSQITITEIL